MEIGHTEGMKSIDSPMGSAMELQHFLFGELNDPSSGIPPDAENFGDPMEKTAGMLATK